VDAGDQGLKKFAVTGYAEENLKRFFETPDDPRPPKEALKELYEKYQPKTIALGMEGSRGVTRSLTLASYKFVAESMGAEAEKRFVPATDLIEDYLSTRIPEEFDTYTQMVQATEILTRRALSNEVIQPGKTRVGDVRRWLYDQLWQCRYTTWFQPDIRLQQKGMTGLMSRGFLGVAPEEIVIQRGDVLHIDFGITYMGLSTDWQKMAYVLNPGETAPPPGLVAAMAKTNALQDALMSDARPGKAAGEVYRQALADMQAKGIQAQIYSHPIGTQGHGLGPALNSRTGEKGNAEGEKPLVKGTYLSVELNTASEIPEWNGQKVFVMMEDDAYLTDDGYKFFRPRQTEYYLIH
jgi:Xaa-Pro dipeptidase